MQQNENTPKHARTDYKGFQTFQEDLARATITEKELSELLVEKKGLEIVRYNNDYKYDTLFRLPGGSHVKVEIKEDFTCARTGNVGLEYSCRGKDSGITISEAQLYFYKVHVSKNETINFLVQTKDLKQAIIDKRYFRTINGGDPGSNSLNYLFKLDVFK